MPEYIHHWLIQLPQKQLFNIKRRKEEEEEGAGMLPEPVEWQENQG